jgi:signal transduction histidine kinase/ligand-binding sensor domain-containing protein/DNA-binding response OmpR family regulator
LVKYLKISLLISLLSFVQFGQNKEKHSDLPNIKSNDNNEIELITVYGELQNNIRDIVQDCHGFLWLASDNGLYKYDGYKFKVYRVNPNDPYSISNNNLTSLLESHHEGNDLLWIGTDGGGLNKLDLDTEHFNCYKFDPKDSNSLSNNRVEVIYEDKNSVLWIGTKGGGLNKFETKTELFSQYLNKNWICEIYEDINGILWIAAYDKGCFRFDPKSEQLINYTAKDTESNGLSNPVVSSIHVDSSNTIWIGTYGGLDKLVQTDSTVSSAKFINFKPKSGNTVDELIYSIYEKDRNNLWISTLRGGLYEFNKNTGQFKSIYQYHNDLSNLITTDFGENWIDRSSALFGMNLLTTAESVNNKFGWLAGNGAMLKTEDGGMTWFSLPIDNDWNILGVDFINKMLGWSIIQTGDSYKILNSKNGGHDWNVQIEFIDEFGMRSIYALNDSTVYVAGTIMHTYGPSGKILKTTNGGLNWIEITPKDKERDYITIQFLDSKNGFVTAKTQDGWFVLRTLDGGRTWQEKSMLGFYRIDKLQFTDKTTCYFIGNNHLLCKTSDGFNSWKIIAEGIVSYSVFDNAIIYAIRDGDIIKSSDGGKTWEKKFTSEKDMMSLKFLNKSTGWALNKPVEFNMVLSLKADKSDALWVGSNQGLNRILLNKKKFNHYDLNKINRNQSEDFVINTIHQSDHDGQDYFWIGTNNGLIKLDRKTLKYKYFRNDPANSNSLSHNEVLSIIEDNDGNLWIGTKGGLNKFNPVHERFTVYKHDLKTRFGLINNVVGALYKDNIGDLWVGTSGGLATFERDAEKFISYDYSIITAICGSGNDGDRAIWSGTSKGLVRFDIGKRSTMSYQNALNQPYSLSNNIVTCLYKSNQKGKEILWIGTRGGLNKLVLPAPLGLVKGEQGPVFIRYTVKDGLPSNLICGISEDDFGNLWISTDNGLSKFNPKTQTFLNFGENDGLQNGKYLPNVYYKNIKGEMHFVGTKGITSFFPDSLKYNLKIPRVAITDFRIFDESVKINPEGLSLGDEYYLSKDISRTDEIRLAYDKNDLSFEFSALDFQNPQKNKYAYKMEGFDDEWIYTNANRRFANYTNLNPGQYVFKVKGTNNDGVWNEAGTSLKIIILPPWWRTGWAYIIYGLLILTALYILRRYELNRQRLRLESEKYQEIDRMKSRFFANISHEFRTPLTLIKGPIQQMLSGDFTENAKKQFRMILRNSNRLMQLINQLLDLSKLDSGEMVLRTSQEDIVPLVNGLTQSFESLAKQKNIDLQFQSSEDEIIAYIDRDKFEKIIINLLSNAFKFTPEGGKVSVSINLPTPQSPPGRGSKGVGYSSPFLEIAISNSGPGISSDQLDKIFDRFYQADDSSVRRHEGTGIGLSLTKELVELHHGEIKAESEPGKATTFTVCLPLGKNHLHPDEILETPTEIASEIDTGLIESTFTYESETETTTHQPAKDSSTLLIVEDNADMRSYMRESLESIYKIIEAENGEEGIRQSLENSPDMIISDVMMPKMDGFQFCTEIKKDERTSHIPVILLTAKASGESKIEGLETGADDYLTKPFDTRELQVRINNLIEQRKRLQKKFQKEIAVSPRDIAVTSIDEKLVQRAIDVVEKNISDPNFDTALMAKEIGISRMLLNTKLKALTGLPTGEFIRTLRLKRAAQLLQQGYGNVTQVAYDVGFQSLSYFAKAFREQFGKSPSQYSSKNESNQNQ